MATSLRWHFAEPGPIQRQRNSKLDEHFAGSGTDRAGDLVREGGQNSMDVRLNSGTGAARVRITFGVLPNEKALNYFTGFQDHAKSLKAQRPKDKVASALNEKFCEYLLFEDFNTTGLIGDPRVLRRYDDEEPNNFHTFFRAEGQTDKVDATKQGSKGVGKVTFLAASKALAILGLTTRDDGKTLLFGTAVLNTHRHEGKDYDGDAWYGTQQPGEGVMPIEDLGVIDRFREDFALEREAGQCGLSIVVPWLETDAEEGVTPDRVIDSILRNHAWPILKGWLSIEVVAASGDITTIDAASFVSILATREDEVLKRQVGHLANLGTWAITHQPNSESDKLGIHGNSAPKWSDPDILQPDHRDRLREVFDSGDPIAVRVPIRIRPKGKKSSSTVSHFDLYLQKETSGAITAGPSVQFVRGGLLLTGMARRVRGVRGLVIAENPALAGLLRSSENPSHTKWNAKPIKNKYTFAPATLKFVLDAAKELAGLLAGDPDKSEPVWTDKLNISGNGPSNSGNGVVSKKKRPKKKNLPSPNPPPPPPQKVRPYRIVVSGDGFMVKPSRKPFKKPLPVRLELRLAYHVRGRNPLKKWHRNDFELTQVTDFPAVNVTGCELEEREPNRLVLRIDNPDEFAFKMTGFDRRRELYCKPRLFWSDDVDNVDIKNENEESADLDHTSDERSIS